MARIGIALAVLLLLINASNFEAQIIRKKTKWLTTRCEGGQG